MRALPRPATAATVLSTLFAALLAAGPARAAESYDNCTGSIAALPAVITTQGVWCLKQDLATAMTSGTAIDVQTNNVTIDCNGFKLGGLAAGPASTTYGIGSVERANTTVRNCTIRGFGAGIVLTSSTGGHLIEDNRLDGNLTAGIAAGGDGSIVRRNLVLATGGSTMTSLTFGISTAGSVQIVDNTIREVSSTVSSANAYGIYYDAATSGGVIARNAISGIVGGDGAGKDFGVVVGNSVGVIIRENNITGLNSLDGTGLWCDSNVDGIVGNVVMDMADPWLNCLDLGQNASD